jgi:hypothetical protein
MQHDVSRFGTNPLELMSKLLANLDYGIATFRVMCGSVKKIATVYCTGVATGAVMRRMTPVTTAMLYAHDSQGVVAHIDRLAVALTDDDWAAVTRGDALTRGPLAYVVAANQYEKALCYTSEARRSGRSRRAFTSSQCATVWVQEELALMEAQAQWLHLQRAAKP